MLCEVPLTFPDSDEASTAMTVWRWLVTNEVLESKEREQT